MRIIVYSERIVQFSMHYPVRLYLKHPPHAIMLTLSVVLNIVSLIWLLVRIHPQEQNVFLHYNILFGVDELGVWWQVFYVPLTAAVILMTNTVLSWFLYQKDKLISYVLLGMTCLCEIFLFIVTALLVFLNV